MDPLENTVLVILEHFEQLEHALNNQIQSRTQFLCQMSPQLISKSLCRSKRIFKRNPFYLDMTSKYDFE